MSKIGEKPIILSDQITAQIEDGSIRIKGPKGEITLNFRPEIKVSLEEKEGKKYLHVVRKNNARQSKALHGLTRTLIANMIMGTEQGFEKKLKIIGTGFRGKMEGGNLVLNVGYSHQVVIKPTQGIEFSVLDNNQIVVGGIDKQLVGQTAASIRQVRPPDAYKGKGIRYLDEVVRKKPGKAVKAVTGS